MTTFEPGLENAWLLSLLFFLLIAVMAGTKKEAIQRMPDTPAKIFIGKGGPARGIQR